VNNKVIIAGARRTPIGSFQGQFNDVPVTDLGATAIAAAIEQAGIGADQVDDVIMGCLLTAGVGQAPARIASRAAGVPDSAAALTVNKACSSGLKAIHLGHDQIRAGSTEIVVAGGMESMSRAPYLLPKARGGYRMGNGEILDHMFFDGLQDPDEGFLMGVYGQRCADKYSFTREEQDAYAIETIERAQRAMDSQFPDEITPVTVKSRKGETVVDRDEEPPRCDIGKIPGLRPAFAKDGTVTAASSSKISDGAAATVLMSEEKARQLGVTPLAVIVAHATHSQAPEWFTTAPIGAIAAVLEKAGWEKGDVDLFEINEAFAAVAMAAIREHGLERSRVNVNGGACALGHPVGASGARIVVTLINALRQRGMQRGIAALCNGGGEATALAIEIPGTG